jgi:hypothetical protein
MIPLPLIKLAPGIKLDTYTLFAELSERWAHRINMDDIDVPPGWMPLVLDMLTAIDRARVADENAPSPATKICEQDGELRVYYDTRSRRVHNVIQEFVAKAQKTCENCGGPGELRTMARVAYAVRCPVCAFLANVGDYR